MSLEPEGPSLRALLAAERDCCARLLPILDAERATAATYDHVALLACLREREAVQAEWKRAARLRREPTQSSAVTLAALASTDPALAAPQQAAAEVAEIERGLLTLGNTAVAGRHVVGGLESGANPFADLDAPGFDASAAYSGPSGAFTLPIGAAQAVALTTQAIRYSAPRSSPSTIYARHSPPAPPRRRASTHSKPPPRDYARSAPAPARASRGCATGATRSPARSTARVLIGGLEDADLTTAITELVQLQNALQATLAAGGTLQTNLLDYLRP